MAKERWDLEERYNSLVSKYKELDRIQKLQEKDLNLMKEKVLEMDLELAKAGDLAYKCSKEMLKYVDIIEGFNAYLTGTNRK